MADLKENQKTIQLSGFKYLYKKSVKQENSSLFMNILLYNSKNESRKPDKNLSLRRLEFMPRNLD